MTSKPIASDRTRFGRRLLIDLAVGVGIIIVIVAAVLFSSHTGIDISGGWLGFVGFTPFVFWTVIKTQKRHWRRISFWVVVGSLLALHLVVLVTILLKYPDLRLIWFAPLSIVEIALFSGVLFNLFDRSGPRNVKSGRAA